MTMDKVSEFILFVKNMRYSFELLLELLRANGLEVEVVGENTIKMKIEQKTGRKLPISHKILRRATQVRDEVYSISHDRLIDALPLQIKIVDLGNGFDYTFEDRLERVSLCGTWAGTHDAFYITDNKLVVIACFGRDPHKWVLLSLSHQLPEPVILQALLEFYKEEPRRPTFKATLFDEFVKRLQMLDVSPDLVNVLTMLRGLLFE